MGRAIQMVETTAFSLSTEIIMVIIGFAAIAIAIAYYFLSRPKRKNDLEVEIRAEQGFGDEIEFMGQIDNRYPEHPIGYKGKIKRIVQRLTGRTDVIFEDEYSKQTVTLYGLVIGNNLLPKINAESMVMRGKWYCCKDATNLQFPWDALFYNKFLQNHDLILESEIEEKVKKKLSEDLEWRGQRSSPEVAQNFDKVNAKKMEAYREQQGI